MLRGVVLAILISCVGGQMILSSTEFLDGHIPSRYACDTTYRDDYRPSPPLQWYRAPTKAQSFVLLMDDMDNDESVQWFVKDIPRDVTSLPADASEVNMPRGSIELTNSKGFDSYSGPCPDFDKMHTYRFRLFAMPTATTHINKIENPMALRAPEIVSQIQDNALYVAVLTATFHLGTYQPPNVTHPTEERITTTTVVNGTVWINGTRVHRNITVTNTTIVTRNTTTERRMRPVIPGQPIVATRFIKPSEALKPQRAHAEVSVEAACSRPQDQATPECVIAQARQAVRGNHSWNDTAAYRHRRVSTQSLVSEGVESFKREVDLWECEEEFRRNAGVRLVGNETQRCAMRMRVTDSLCNDPIYPRQFVCGEEFGLSPSLMWKDAPAETQSFVVMVEESSDLEFVRDYGKIYWLVSNIPVSNSRIEAGASAHETLMPALSVQHRNSFNHTGYTAPCPGEHDQRIYRLHVFAMPRPQTKMFPSLKMDANAVIEELQKEALCMSTVEMPFSFKRSMVTATRQLESNKNVASSESAAGEIEMDPTA